ncbi:MAG: ATP-binding protein [Flavobacteriales bacterium]
MTIFTFKGLVEQLKQKEEKNIKNYIQALELFITSKVTDNKVRLFLLDIILSNQTMPIVVVDKEKKMRIYKNIPTYRVNQKNLERTLKYMKSIYEPTKLNPSEKALYIYYENYSFLDKLRFYSIILIFILVLFSFYSYWYLYTLKKAEKDHLWVGMSKETAHQIGTPLSALIGWVELLKTEHKDHTTMTAIAIQEMEKDIKRLEYIAERFSKIGSQPELSYQNIVKVTKQIIEYLKHRISANIHFQFESNKEKILVPLNEILYGWAIENVLKNSVDAMRNKGTISVKVTDKKDKVEIDIKDQGKGMPPSKFRRIFEAGYSTKKGGWGYGLPLTKRIIEKYHPKGKIFVDNSGKTKGTTTRIIFHLDPQNQYSTLF